MQKHNVKSITNKIFKKTSNHIPKSYNSRQIKND